MSLTVNNESVTITKSNSSKIGCQVHAMLIIVYRLIQAGGLKPVLARWSRAEGIIQTTDYGLDKVQEAITSAAFAISSVGLKGIRWHPLL